jgi:phosphohistidine swiveling domain-containing protein
VGHATNQPTWVIDTLASEKYPIYSRANAGEVCPDPMSPLSATMTMAGPGEDGYRDAFIAAGTFTPDEFEADRPNCIGVFGGYMYLNMSLARIYGVRMPGMSPEMVDEQYYGDMPGITPYAEEARPTDENADRSEQLAGYLGELFTTADLPELRADRDQMWRRIERRPDLAKLTDQELVDHARAFMPMFRRLFCQHILISAGAGFGIGTVAGVCDAIGRPELTMTLCSGLGDVDSAAPSWAMWELSRLDEDSDEYRAGFDDFLRRFGSRGPNEWDLHSNTWGTDPMLPTVAIRAMRPAPDADSPQARTELRIAEREQATATVREMLAGADDETTGTFEAGLQCAHVYAAGRERSKTNCILLVHEMRLSLRELGRRHAEAGHIADLDQIFVLTERELDGFVREPTSFSDLIAEREQTWRQMFDHVPPFVTNGAPEHWTTWPRRDAVADGQEAVVGLELTGISGCPGVARGRARVVLDPADPQGLEPGEILVAPVTDPAWTPLFVPAAAVVVDVGAQITHAVIVSRELGLPCVVSVTGATKTIPDGAIIEVDGGAGTVTIISLDAADA